MHKHLAKHIELLPALQSLSSIAPPLKQCATCTQPARKQWMHIVNGKLRSRFLCADCCLAAEQASHSTGPSEHHCSECGTRSPHGYNWLFDTQGRRLCTMCHTCHKQALSVPHVSLLAGPPVLRSQLRTLKCGLCPSTSALIGSFFQHRLCGQCLRSAPTSAHELIQARLALMTHQWFGFAVKTLNVHSLSVAASHLIALHRLPEPKIVQTIGPLLTRPPAEDLTAFFQNLPSRRGPLPTAHFGLEAFTEHLPAPPAHVSTVLLMAPPSTNPTRAPQPPRPISIDRSLLHQVTPDVTTVTVLPTRRPRKRPRTQRSPITSPPSPASPHHSQSSHTHSNHRSPVPPRQPSPRHLRPVCASSATPPPARPVPTSSPPLRASANVGGASRGRQRRQC